MIIVFAAASCGSKVNTERNIAIAREAITRGDYNEALSALDENSAAMTDTTASPSALAETAVLYCVIDEKTHTDANMSKALKCYQLAVQINADSVNHFFARLSPDEKCQLDILAKLTNASHDINEYVEPYDTDSIPSGDYTGTYSGNYPGYDDSNRHSDDIINDIDIIQ